MRTGPVVSNCGMKSNSRPIGPGLNADISFEGILHACQSHDGVIQILDRNAISHRGQRFLQSRQ